MEKFCRIVSRLEGTNRGVVTITGFLCSTSLSWGGMLQVLHGGHVGLLVNDGQFGTCLRLWGLLLHSVSSRTGKEK
eukprot:3211333-Amphidinium_carterae.1